MLKSTCWPETLTETSALHTLVVKEIKSAQTDIKLTLYPIYYNYQKHTSMCFIDMLYVALIISIAIMLCNMLQDRNVYLEREVLTKCWDF